ncbi:hypothetical protein OBBRIDRAFT_784780 [Obba rivulosa]|uniref:Uncharacterized protein n=1 Tax=Obba rivulosa TaxID=1052685 RepID=A0A8E2AJ83_9APHY|nr:hypothetical protein OBBRIDRAFT_784780 [Obba rivulosa]
MPEKIVETPFPLIDVDPYAGRVIRYMRPSDYAWWAGLTAAFPGALWFWERMDKMATKPPRTALRVGGILGFVGGFLFAYQRSSLRFWGWTENKREEEMDYKEMSTRAAKGLPLYGESNEPEWVQGAAHRNSVYSQLKFQVFPMFNLVNHPYHGVDPAKYKPKEEPSQ